MWQLYLQKKNRNFISTGGEAKFFLASDALISINDEEDRRRGRKLRTGDVIQIDNQKFVIE